MHQEPVVEEAASEPASPELPTFAVVTDTFAEDRARYSAEGSAFTVYYIWKRTGERLSFDCSLKAIRAIHSQLFAGARIRIGAGSYAGTEATIIGVRDGYLWRHDDSEKGAGAFNASNEGDLREQYGLTLIGAVELPGVQEAAIDEEVARREKKARSRKVNIVTDGSIRDIFSQDRVGHHNNPFAGTGVARRVREAGDSSGSDDSEGSQGEADEETAALALRRELVQQDPLVVISGAPRQAHFLYVRVREPFFFPLPLPGGSVPSAALATWPIEVVMYDISTESLAEYARRAVPSGEARGRLTEEQNVQELLLKSTLQHLQHGQRMLYTAGLQRGQTCVIIGLHGGRLVRLDDGPRAFPTAFDSRDPFADAGLVCLDDPEDVVPCPPCPLLIDSALSMSTTVGARRTSAVGGRPTSPASAAAGRSGNSARGVAATTAVAAFADLMESRRAAQRGTGNTLLTHMGVGPDMQQTFYLPGACRLALHCKAAQSSAARPAPVAEGRRRSSVKTRARIQAEIRQREMARWLPFTSLYGDLVTYLGVKYAASPVMMVPVRLVPGLRLRLSRRGSRDESGAAGVIRRVKDTDLSHLAGTTFVVFGFRSAAAGHELDPVAAGRHLCAVLAAGSSACREHAATRTPLLMPTEGPSAAAAPLGPLHEPLLYGYSESLGRVVHLPLEVFASPACAVEATVVGFCSAPIVLPAAVPSVQDAGGAVETEAVRSRPPLPARVLAAMREEQQRGANEFRLTQLLAEHGFETAEPPVRPSSASTAHSGEWHGASSMCSTSAAGQDDMDDAPQDSPRTVAAREGAVTETAMRAQLLAADAANTGSRSAAKKRRAVRSGGDESVDILALFPCTCARFRPKVPRPADAAAAARVEEAREMELLLSGSREWLVVEPGTVGSVALTPALVVLGAGTSVFVSSGAEIPDLLLPGAVVELLTGVRYGTRGVVLGVHPAATGARVVVVFDLVSYHVEFLDPPREPFRRVPEGTLPLHDLFDLLESVESSQRTLEAPRPAALPSSLRPLTSRKDELVSWVCVDGWSRPFATATADTALFGLFHLQRIDVSPIAAPAKAGVAKAVPRTRSGTVLGVFHAELWFLEDTSAVAWPLCGSDAAALRGRYRITVGGLTENLAPFYDAGLRHGPLHVNASGLRFGESGSGPSGPVLSHRHRGTVGPPVYIDRTSGATEGGCTTGGVETAPLQHRVSALRPFLLQWPLRGPAHLPPSHSGRGSIIPTEQALPFVALQKLLPWEVIRGTARHVAAVAATHAELWLLVDTADDACRRASGGRFRGGDRLVSAARLERPVLRAGEWHHFGPSVRCTVIGVAHGLLMGVFDDDLTPADDGLTAIRTVRPIGPLCDFSLGGGDPLTHASPHATPAGKGPGPGDPPEFQRLPTTAFTREVHQQLVSEAVKRRRADQQGAVHARREGAAQGPADASGGVSALWRTLTEAKFGPLSAFRGAPDYAIAMDGQREGGHGQAVLGQALFAGIPAQRYRPFDGPVVSVADEARVEDTFARWAASGRPVDDGAFLTFCQSLPQDALRGRGGLISHIHSLFRHFPAIILPELMSWVLDSAGLRPLRVGEGAIEASAKLALMGAVVATPTGPPRVPTVAEWYHHQVVSLLRLEASRRRGLTAAEDAATATILAEERLGMKTIRQRLFDPKGTASTAAGAADRQPQTVGGALGHLRFAAATMRDDRDTSGGGHSHARRLPPPPLLRPRSSAVPWPFPYILAKGYRVRFDISASACERFGMYHGQQYRVGRGDMSGEVVTVLGVLDDRLWRYSDVYEAAPFDGSNVSAIALAHGLELVPQAAKGRRGTDPSTSTSSRPLSDEGLGEWVPAPHVRTADPFCYHTIHGDIVTFDVSDTALRDTGLRFGERYWIGQADAAVRFGRLASQVGSPRKVPRRAIQSPGLSTSGTEATPRPVGPDRRLPLVVVTIVGMLDGRLWYCLDGCGAQAYTGPSTMFASDLALRFMYSGPVVSTALDLIHDQPVVVQHAPRSGAFTVDRSSEALSQFGALEHGQQLAFMSGPLTGARTTVIGVRHNRLYHVPEGQVHCIPFDSPPEMLMRSVRLATVGSGPVPAVEPLVMASAFGKLRLQHFRFVSSSGDIYTFDAADSTCRAQFGFGHGDRVKVSRPPKQAGRCVIIIGVRGKQLWFVDEHDGAANVFHGVRDHAGLMAAHGLLLVGRSALREHIG